MRTLVEYAIIHPQSGYGLVVKYVLAKDESGVRFSLSAQRHKNIAQVFLQGLRSKTKNLFNDLIDFFLFLGNIPRAA